MLNFRGVFVDSSPFVCGDDPTLTSIFFQWVGSTTTYKVGRLSRSLEIELYHVITPFKWPKLKWVALGLFHPYNKWPGDGFKLLFLFTRKLGKINEPHFHEHIFSMVLFQPPTR